MDHLWTRILDAVRLGVSVLRHVVAEVGGQVGEVPSGPLTKEEVDKVLRAGFADCPDAINYRTSIVDLCKVLKIDSTLEHRKQMAKFFGYQGKLDGSAEMNTWLHAEVMRRLAEFYPRPGNT